MSKIAEICDCFSGLVGFRGICDPSLGCSLYLNQLPGISSMMMADLTDLERQTVASIFADIETRASVFVESSIREAMQGQFQRNESTGMVTTGQIRFDDPLQPLDSSHLYGHLFDLSQSQFNEIVLYEIRIYSDFPVSITFHVFDTATGKRIADVNADLSAGVNIIELDPDLSFSSKTDSIFIGVDGGLVQTIGPNYKTDCLCNCHKQGILNGYNHSKCHDCGCQNSGCFKIPKTGPVDQNTIIQVADGTYAECRFVLCYENRCSWTAFICQSKDELMLPFWYALGIEFWKEPGFGKYIGTFQLVSDDWKEKQVKYLSKKLADSIQLFIEQIEPDRVCFQCQSDVNIITELP